MAIKFKVKAVEQNDAVTLTFKWPLWFNPGYKRAIVQELKGFNTYTSYVTDYEIDSFSVYATPEDALEKSCAMLDTANRVYEESKAADEERNKVHRERRKADKKAQKAARYYTREDCE